MFLAEAMTIMRLTDIGWRVHFDRLRGGKWIPDFFPAGEEAPLRSKGEAETLALIFRERVRRRYRNIRALADTEPERIVSGAIVIAYCRVSTDKQDAECKAQKDLIAPYIRGRLMTEPVNAKWDGEYYIDPGISSKIDLHSRPAGFEATRRLRPGDHFVIARGDRAFGSTGQACRSIDAWHQRGVFAHVIDIGMDTSTFWGRIMLKQMGINKEIERSMVSGRTLEKMASNRLRGRPTNGKVPLGYKKVGVKGNRHFVPEVRELVLMRAMHQWKMEGHAVKAIAKLIVESGLDQTTNRQWERVKVFRAIRQYERWLIDDDKILKHLPPLKTGATPAEAVAP